MLMVERNTQLLGADFVRTAACLMVLCHHLAQRMAWGADMGVLEPLRAFTQFGSFGVAVFFVLSGFLLARPFWLALDAGQPMPSLRTFALRRAARIAPGFWLALVATFVLSFTVFGAKFDEWLVLRFLSGLLFVSDWHWTTLFPVEVNGPLWSIGFEVTAYALLPLGLAIVFAAGPRTGPVATRIIWLAVIGLALAAHWLFAEFVPVEQRMRGWNFGLQGGAKVWMPRYNPFSLFAIFAIGAFAAGLQVMLRRFRSWIFDGLALAALAAVGWLLWQQGAARDAEGYGLLDVPYGFPLFQLAIGALLMAAPMSVLIGRLLDIGPVRYVARVSFGIYVWHYLVLELVRRFWAPEMDHGAMGEPIQFAVVSSVVVAITMAIAHLSFHLIEAPAIEWARNRSAYRPSGPTLSPAAG